VKEAFLKRANKQGPPFLVKSLVRKTSEITVNGGWKNGRTLGLFSRVDQPVSSVCVNDRDFRLIETEVRDGAYQIKLKGTGGANGPGEPLYTVQAGGLHHALIEPSVQVTMVLPQHSGGEVRPASEPVPTVACDGAIRVVTSETAEMYDSHKFIVRYYGQSAGESIDKPLSAVNITASPTQKSPNNHSWSKHVTVTLFLVVIRESAPVDAPLPTGCGNRGDGAIACATVSNRSTLSNQQRGAPPKSTSHAYVVKYFRTGIAKSIEQPLYTVTGKHPFGLVIPELVEFDPEKEGRPKNGKTTFESTTGSSNWS